MDVPGSGMDDPFGLAGTRALVTGASGGLGRHFAGLLNAHGADVVIAARRPDRLSQVLGDMAGPGKSAAVAMDVTDAASIARGFEDAEAAFGPINCLVNNAGIATGVGALDLSVADFDAVMDTNARGAFLVAQQAARSMKAAGQGGRIVNIASILGLRVASAVTPYSMSKAAVIQMTHALALEWARYGIRVNALAPGYVETEISSGFLETEAGKATVRRVPMRRIVRIEELDAPFLLLAGNASSAMTGVVLPVDCGHLVSTL